MRALLLFILLLAACAFLPCPPELTKRHGEVSEKKPMHVLFIGNSFTFGHNMPNVVRALTQSAPQPIETEMAVVGGYTMVQHVDRPETLNLLRSHHWDYVVLQDCSDCTIYRYPDFLNGMRRMTSLVRAQGAEPLYYLTWADKNNARDQVMISAAYTKLGAEQRVDIVPAGDIWSELSNGHPEINLYDPDNHHAGELGAMLTALAFIRALEPEFTPAADDEIDLPPEFLYEAFFPKHVMFADSKTAEMLQRAVAAVEPRSGTVRSGWRSIR